jgi:hypothetical protein
MFKIHSFIPFAKYLTLLFGFAFAAGASALGGDSGGADPAVVAGGAEGEAEVPADGAEAAVEGAEGEAEAEGAAEGEAQPEVKAEPVAAAGDGRAVPQAIRNHLAKLKASGVPADIKLAKEINDAVWGYSSLKTEIQKNFPQGGLKEAIELKQTVDNLAGAKSLQEIGNEVQEYRQMDEQFINGDPEFIRTAVAQYPEGFKKLAPEMINTWASVDPDAYDRHMTSLITATLGNNGFGTALTSAIDYLDFSDPQKQNAPIQKAIALLNGNREILAGWDKFARSKPAAPAVDPKAAENQQAQAKLAEEQKQFFLQKVSDELTSHTGKKITENLTSLKRQVPETGRGVFDKQVEDTLWAKMAAEPNFNVKKNAFIANKDRAGLIGFLQSRAEQYFKDAVETVHKRLYGNATLGAQKPKPKPTVAANGAKPGTNGTQSAAKGWVKVSPDFDASQIDRRATPERDIVFGKKAILKDGRKVYWGDKIPV